MGVTVGDIVSYIENWAPLSYAEDYDRPGLELGHTDAPVRIIVLSVDASQKAVDFAVSHRADLLLVHHPLFFHPLSNGSDRDLTGRRVLKLAENHIALYKGMSSDRQAASGKRTLLSGFCPPDPSSVRPFLFKDVRGSG